MVALQSIPGLHVTIKVDGRVAKEYDATEGEDIPDGLSFHDPAGLGQEALYIAKYIESKPGKHFEVCIRREACFPHYSDHIAYRTKVDNLSLSLKHDQSHDKPTRPWSSSQSSFLHGVLGRDCYEECLFRFAALDIADADQTIPAPEMKKQLEAAKTLGIIRVAFYHMRLGETYRLEPTHQGRSKAPSNKVHEKALKGRSVDTRATWDKTGVRYQTVEKVQSNYFDPSKRPFAVFEFRYRTMDGLIKECIVPRPSTPDAADAMTEEEARQLARQFLEMKKAPQASPADDKYEKEEKPRVKRERAESRPPMPDKPFSERYKVRRMASGRFVVDLTDD